MFKFFRKIRQNLLNKNKVGKYLLYGFGEIILVIIGILIALNLNQRSEKKKAEAKIDTIFKDVLKDLETNINTSVRLINYYQKKDSLTSLVLNENLSHEDYTNENSRSLWRVATNRNNYYIRDNAYNLLIANIDVIPKKYSKAVSFLSTLHNRHQIGVEQQDKRVNDIVLETHDGFRENQPWYSELDYTKSKEAINYRLHDYRYKNIIRQYYGGAVRTLRTQIVIYRGNAIRCYKEIASVLNKPLDSINFIVNEQILKSYVGTYISDKDSEFKAGLTFENGHLHLERTNPSNKVSLINISSENEFAIVIPRGVVKFNKSNSGDGITMTIHEGHIPVTYTKIKP